MADSDLSSDLSPCRGSRLWRSRLWLAVLGVAAVALALLAALRAKMLAEIGWDGSYTHIYYHLMAAYDWLGAAVNLLALLAAVGLSRHALGEQAAALLAKHRVVVGGLVVLLMFALANLVCGGRALTQDEFAPLTQGRIFAAGKLAGEWPVGMMNLLMPKLYWDWFFVKAAHTGRFVSNYSPGHALLIAPFSWLGIETASNATLSGLSLLAIASIAERLDGRRGAGNAMLFTLASPVFWAYGLGFYSMPAHLLVNMLFVLFMMQNSLGATAAAGAVGGFGLALHNPFPHAVFAAPWLLAVARAPGWYTRLPCLAVCYAVVYVPLALGWDDYKQSLRQEGGHAASTTEGQGTTPAPSISWEGRIAAYAGQVSSAFTFDDAWPVLQHRIFAFLKLVSWDAPGLLVLACWSAWRDRRDRWKFLLAASVVTTFFGYTFVRFSGGHGWGYRYFFPTWGALPILAGTAVAGRERVPCSIAAVLTAAAIAAPVAIPARLWHIHDFYAEHFSAEPSIPAGAGLDGAPIDPRHLLVFINKSDVPFRHDLVQNDPFLRSGPIRMVSLGDDVSETVARGLAANQAAVPLLVARNPCGSIWCLRPITATAAPE